MNAANIIAASIFGLIGWAVFIYGKKQSNFKPIAIGIILMTYTYFVSNLIFTYLIGVGLIALLFIFR